MFDQTFVDGTQKTSKPVSLFVSTLIQICVLGILLLIPLVYTATLPGALFKSQLILPRPPVVATPTNVPGARPGRFVRVFSSRAIFVPVAIPEQVSSTPDLGAPPEIAATGNGAATMTDALPGGLTDTGSQPPPQFAEEPKPKPPVAHAIRVGTGAAEAKLINKVTPPYPSLAKAARIQGSVEFSAVISKDGNIENLQLVRGHPLLVTAAKDAVLQWKYRPTLLNGQPVEVITQIVVNFTLTQ